MGEVYKNKIRLETPRGVQRLLARMINQLNDGSMKENTARTIGYLAGVLLKSFEVAEFEERISKLEGALDEIRKKA